jgi:hypothetical protein
MWNAIKSEGIQACNDFSHPGLRRADSIVIRFAVSLMRSFIWFAPAARGAICLPIFRRGKPSIITFANSAAEVSGSISIGNSGSPNGNALVRILIPVLP